MHISVALTVRQKHRRCSKPYPGPWASMYLFCELRGSAIKQIQASLSPTYSYFLRDTWSKESAPRQLNGCSSVQCAHISLGHWRKLCSVSKYLAKWSELAGTAPLGSLDAWQDCFSISISAAFSRRVLDTRLPRYYYCISWTHQYFSNVLLDWAQILY